MVSDQKTAGRQKGEQQGEHFVTFASYSSKTVEDQPENRQLGQQPPAESDGPLGPSTPCHCCAASASRFSRPEDQDRRPGHGGSTDQA